ncbi:uncharacterized protein PV07_11776 [Cladophialophora immunda]|uniref:LIP-domain-containing protein n=1 Tax=Cladophialophora immunda TaxID=569365 RepID=A0A0D2CJ70_9EURO|nr:uncharacterized protein PV07_11776 [Cladophialophora immunda]KIW23589.1 hypothetical protein PV07_11776 [Cladophialophora immunda]OQV09386.1 hypothetical protein CLAIMM_13514 isoform 1 [Cladophialophora immunda]OQV09387.1 hypothetical protein CLAIMM_13514 isoform 2 [Cladophialophora immunda]
MRRILDSFTYALLFSLSTALPATSPAIAARSGLVASFPLPPSQDSFYTAPTGYESAAPGTILRLREAVGNLTSIYNASSAAYNILYRTTDAQYQPAWAVTTLFVPSHPSSDALLSYQIPYNTADVDHSPSYVLGSELATGLILSDINSALNHGWFVNVPDFEGPSASFGSGVAEGHATLDSVRAVLSAGFGLSSDARYAMWGYSGGSIASEWAAELQVQYAPELNFSGVALGGLVPNGTTILHTIDGTPAAGLIPSFLIGVMKQYPAAYHYLVSNLKASGPYNATGFLAVQNMSYLEAAVAFMNQSVLNDYFINGTSLIQQPIIQRVFDVDGLMGYHGVPQMPTFMYKATHDEYSPVGDTDSLVARYCNAGANILYQRNRAGNHLDEETNGDARAFDWLNAALNGTLMMQRGCTIQNVTVDISSHAPFTLPP